MGLDLVSGLIAVISLGFAAYQTYQAKQSDKRLKATQASLSELEKNYATSDLKLIKAMEFYNKGHYKDLNP